MVFDFPTNVTKPEDLLNIIVLEMPILPTAFLFIILIILALSGYNMQKRRTEQGNIFLWLMLSSFITSVLAIIVNLYAGLISISMMILFIGLTLIFTLLYLLGGDN